MATLAQAVAFAARPGTYVLGVVVGWMLDVFGQKEEPFEYQGTTTPEGWMTKEEEDDRA